MSAVSDTIERILIDFSSEETLIQEKLQALRTKRSEVADGHRTRIPLRLDTPEDVLRTKEDALRRNKALKREINISMGKLRSKKCYNPAEENLDRMIEKYSEILSREDVD